MKPRKGNRTKVTCASDTTRPSTGPARTARTDSARITNSKQTKRSTEHLTGRPKDGYTQNSTRGFSGAPSLWTKEMPNTKRSGGAGGGVLSAIGRVLVSLLSFIGRVLQGIIRAFISLISHSKLVLIGVIIIVIVLVGYTGDTIANWGKAYPGVHIGTVDVSGKTVDEMRVLVEQAYAERLSQGNATIYANNDAAAIVADKIAQAEDAALAQQRSVEEALARKQFWTASAASLNAKLPLHELSQEALMVGRETGGFASRISAFFSGWQIPLRATYDQGMLESLATEVDATIGDPRIDFGIKVEKGVSSVTQGHDGNMIDRAVFMASLDQAFLEDEQGQGSFVAHANYAPLRIDADAAQKASDKVNAALAGGVQFTYAGTMWEASATDVGDWVSTRVEENGGDWQLIPFIDEQRAKPSILTQVQQNRSENPLTVSFENNDGSITVHTDGQGEIPIVSETVQTLEAELFGAEGSSKLAGQPASVAVARGTAPEKTSFEEALDLGLVTSISSFTTDFTNGAGTENRNFNIRLVSDLLSDSIVKPGEKWSFNKTAGECNTERGFLGAGAIVDGEYDDAVGGGICQVATTVFNSVYEAGYPVVTRHNHSLYIASYPAGRDAAVSWPDLDLVWKNDGSSDVLVKTSYTDSSVTITLYGIDPNYRVSSSVGSWAEGEEHKTKTERNELMTPGASYIKTAGNDGKSIKVVRSVSSADGVVLHTDAFYSTYDPITEVIIAGPETQAKTSTETSTAQKTP